MALLQRTSGHTLRFRRRLSAVCIEEREIRRAASVIRKSPLPQFRSPSRRNKTQEMKLHLARTRWSGIALRLSNARAQPTASAQPSPTRLSSVWTS